MNTINSTLNPKLFPLTPNAKPSTLAPEPVTFSPEPFKPHRKTHERWTAAVAQAVWHHCNISRAEVKDLGFRVKCLGLRV